MNKINLKLILLLVIFCFSGFGQADIKVDSAYNYKLDSLYLLGNMEGRKAKLHSNPGIAAALITAINPLLGGIFTIVASTKKPPIEAAILGNPNAIDSLFKKGFQKGMHSQKKAKLWTGAGIVGSSYASLILLYLIATNGGK